ncbi:hypothetical protein AB2L57_10710 [Microbacterium sp. HA-8]|uniref:hypothetical protein n=1 Tax=Microbacterium sp. HA-8 TaxID=3234200 RepID=UPI0038F61B24
MGKRESRDWGTPLVSALALVVSALALLVSVDSSRADRQDRFDELRTSCLDVLGEIETDASEVLYRSHREVISNEALRFRTSDLPMRYWRGCVLPGIVPTGSAFDAALDEISSGLEFGLAPFVVSYEGQTEEERDEIMTASLAASVYLMSDLVWQTRGYVQDLPDESIYPWQERAIPEPVYDEESGVLEPLEGVVEPVD